MNTLRKDFNKTAASSNAWLNNYVPGPKRHCCQPVDTDATVMILNIKNLGYSFSTIGNFTHLVRWVGTPDDCLMLLTKTNSSLYKITCKNEFPNEKHRILWRVWHLVLAVASCRSLWSQRSHDHLSASGYANVLNNISPLSIDSHVRARHIWARSVVYFPISFFFVEKTSTPSFR